MSSSNSDKAKMDSKFASDVYNLGQKVINTCLEMNRIGINQGTSGNVSARLDFANDNGSFLITPSGVPYSELTPETLVIIRISDTGEKPEILDGPFKDTKLEKLAPSTEWRLHRDIYLMKEKAVAVLHAHPTYSTVLSCVHSNIPSFHYMIAVAGGSDIRCTPYYTFGTRELADAMKEALEDRFACLLGNHGMICFSEKSVEKSLWLANEVETLARQYYHVKQFEISSALSKSTNLKEEGKKYLNDKEMETIKQKFKTYGQKIVDKS